MAPLKTTTSPTPSPAVSLWRHLATLQVFLEPRVFFHVHVSIFTSKGWGKWLPHSIYLVNWRSYRKLHFLMGKSTIFMAIFNSYVYVKLPEGSGKVRWVTKLTKLLGDSNQWTVKVIFLRPTTIKSVQTWITHRAVWETLLNPHTTIWNYARFGNKDAKHQKCMCYTVIICYMH